MSSQTIRQVGQTYLEMGLMRHLTFSLISKKSGLDHLDKVSGCLTARVSDPLDFIVVMSLCSSGTHINIQGTSICTNPTTFHATPPLRILSLHLEYLDIRF